VSSNDAVEAVASAKTWEERVALIRKIPEQFGTAQHQAIYAAIATKVYVPNLAPDFGYVNWRDEYELGTVEGAYLLAHKLTEGFTLVDANDLARTIEAEPTTLRIFRLLLGFNPQEFAASTSLVAKKLDSEGLSLGRVKGIEGGSPVDPEAAVLCAEVVDLGMRGELFPPPLSPELRTKIQKPDTVSGWKSVREYAKTGVPLPTFLHQRHYGGAFRQLLDATSTKRGDIIEDAVESLFKSRGIPYVRTGSANQKEIAKRFGITIKPAPDFVVYSARDTLRALLECKGANDGGTARDKAARFRSLRTEANRLGGIPVFAVLAGLGWTRTADALGPVIGHTDGRTFTLPTLDEMLSVQPFPDLSN
jgi:hypothetical protein